VSLRAATGGGAITTPGFPHHVGRVRVLAQALEPGLAQQPVGGPLGEGNLAGQPGSTQCTPARGGLPRSNGGVCRSSFPSDACGLRSIASSNPVPTLPVYVSRPSAS
jgi:hypothetical protein